MAAAGRVLRVRRLLGLTPYGAGLALQESAAREARGGGPREGGLPADALLVVEHPPVFTVGRRATVHNVLSSGAELAGVGAEVVNTERGGDVTFHGPGMLVLYPVLPLRALGLGVRAYVEKLEDVMVAAAARHGVEARGRVPWRSGCWVEDRKLGAVGVRVAGGVTTHGLAFNVAPDLDFFRHIVPCGLEDVDVTSLARELGGEAPPLDRVAEQLAQEFARTFGYEPQHVRWRPERAPDAG